MPIRARVPKIVGFVGDVSSRWLIPRIASSDPTASASAPQRATPADAQRRRSRRPNPPTTSRGRRRTSRAGSPGPARAAPGRPTESRTITRYRRIGEDGRRGDEPEQPRSRRRLSMLDIATTTPIAPRLKRTSRRTFDGTRDIDDERRQQDGATEDPGSAQYPVDHGRAPVVGRAHPHVRDRSSTDI